MSVAMTASPESESERTELSTQVLPTIPTVQEMKTWDEEKVLRWIQQRDRNILKGDNLDNFNKAGIHGRAFLFSSYNFFSKECGLSPRASLGLENLVDEVKEGKFILWM
jgi:Trm5-related predicted tRNA methylase